MSLLLNCYRIFNLNATLLKVTLVLKHKNPNLILNNKHARCDPKILIIGGKLSPNFRSQ